MAEEQRWKRKTTNAVTLPSVYATNDHFLVEENAKNQNSLLSLHNAKSLSPEVKVHDFGR
jgi:hypothetical protein